MVPSYRHTPTFLTKGCEAFPSTLINLLVLDLYVVFSPSTQNAALNLVIWREDLFEVDTRTPGSVSHVYCLLVPARAGALRGENLTEGQAIGWRNAPIRGEVGSGSLGDGALLLQALRKLSKASTGQGTMLAAANRGVKPDPPASGLV